MVSVDEKVILCVGEALIDILSAEGVTSEHVGGSVLNVACGTAALGHRTALAAWWGRDDHGAMIEQYAARHGVEVVPGSAGASRTPVALARLDAKGNATYEFDIEWQLPPLPGPDELGHLHTGSLGAVLEPGGSAVLSEVRQLAAAGRTISYDPNVRPSLMGSPDQVRERIEQIVGSADVVKASDEDIAWLYGQDVPAEQVMRQWLVCGPALVVVTRGSGGALAALAGQPTRALDAAVVEVGDTVGAGDSFMAGLLSGLLDLGLLGSSQARTRLRAADWSTVDAALRRAVVAAGITVGRVGAYAPTRTEVARFTVASSAGPQGLLGRH